MKTEDTAELEMRLKELEIRKREVELPVELAQLGLRGTLTGALAGCVMVIALALVGTLSDRAQITGTHLCIMMGMVAAAVSLYGAFVFDRSMLMSGKWRDNHLAISTGNQRGTPYEDSTNPG